MQKAKKIRLELIINIGEETEGSTDEEEKQLPKTSTHTGGCASSEGVSVIVYFVHYVKCIWSTQMHTDEEIGENTKIIMLHAQKILTRNPSR